MVIENCIFCHLDKADILQESKNFFVINDRFPVTQGHKLIITKKHKADFFSLDTIETNDLSTLLHELRNNLVKQDTAITGFNVGMNCGISAGQTIFHCHIHLIPRRDNDCIDPRGGVRGVISSKQKY